MKKRCCLILCIVGWGYPAYAEKTLPIDDPDALRAAIENSCEPIQIRGIIHCKRNEAFKQLIGEDFMSDDSPYQRVLSHIETGDDRWLKVADALACCVDAGTSETLGISIAVALTHAPETILRRTPVNKLKSVCTVPFWEPTKEQFEAHVKAVKTALKLVKDSALQDKRGECLKLIDARGVWHE